MAEHDDLETWHNPTESTVWVKVPDGSGGWKEVIVAAGRPIQMTARTREVNELECAAGQSPFRNGLLVRRTASDLSKLQPALPPPPVETGTDIEDVTHESTPAPKGAESVKMIDDEGERDDLAKSEAASTDLTDDDMAKLLAGPIRAIQSEVESIANADTLRRMIEVGTARKVNPNKLAVVSERLEALNRPRQAPIGTRPTT